MGVALLATQAGSAHRGSARATHPNASRDLSLGLGLSPTSAQVGWEALRSRGKLQDKAYGPASEVPEPTSVPFSGPGSHEASLETRGEG